MTGQATPPELPPGLLEEYLAGMRTELATLATIAERLAAAKHDRAAIEALRHAAHKIHGSAGSFGFMEASRLAAGMEATAKDWADWPNDPEVERAPLARWFVGRLAELLGLTVPRAAAAPRPPAVSPLPRVGSSPRSPAPAPPAPPPPPKATPPAAKPGSPPPAAPPPATALTVPEVIYVEDDAALAELLEYGLRAHGYRFAAYRNGREALRALLALDVQGTQPLLLLDVDLPALDGYSIFDALQRERPGTYRVVFTTVHGTEEEQLRGLEAGALDYLVKPMSLRVALEKIKRWVGR
jgi:CheY-like chemotaxis protein